MSKKEFQFECKLQSIKPNKIQIISENDSMSDCEAGLIFFEIDPKVLRPIISSIDKMNEDEINKLIEDKELRVSILVKIDYSHKLGESYKSHPTVGGVTGNNVRDVEGHNYDIEDLIVTVYQEDHEVFDIDLDPSDVLESWIDSKIPDLD